MKQTTAKENFINDIQLIDRGKVLTAENLYAQDGLRQAWLDTELFFLYISLVDEDAKEHLYKIDLGRPQYLYKFALNIIHTLEELGMDADLTCFMRFLTNNNGIYPKTVLEIISRYINLDKNPYCTKYENPKGFRWIASSNDGCFEDGSQEVFATREECYNDMRNAVLEKMKWNTDFHEDFEEDDDVIGYDVQFSRNKIVHTSYSGTYTYTMLTAE